MKKMNLNENENLDQKASKPIENIKNEVDEKVEVVENQNLSSESTETKPALTKKIAKAKNKNRKEEVMTEKTKKVFISICVVATIAGIMTGFGAFKLKGASKIKSKTELNAIAEDISKIAAGDIFGVKNEDTFADNAQGYVKKGGVNGEGSHSLLREGGASKTVTLTSSVTDLDQFIDMEIKIWGETHKAQQSGWFMDVGRVEVVNPDAEAPIQELE